MTHGYSVQIIWSKEDEAYLAIVQELPGCVADGQTPEEALLNVKEIVQEWISTAKDEKRAIPKPMSFEDFEEMNRKFHAGIQKHIQSTVQAAVNDIVPKVLEGLKSQEGEKHWSPWNRTGLFEFTPSR